MSNTADVTDGKPIAVLLQSISGVSAINPLVAFNDVHGGKKGVLFLDTTRLRPFFLNTILFVVKWCAYQCYSYLSQRNLFSLTLTVTRNRISNLSLSSMDVVKGD
jgi:hypothetical protein